MKKENLEISTMLNYMNIVLDVGTVFEQSYSPGPREVDKNFYLTRYRIEREGHSLCIRWINLNEEEHFVVFRKPPFRNGKLNKLYYMLRRTVLTTDRNRLYNVLRQVVFPDFCNELQLGDLDFLNADNYTEAANLVMCSIYKNFFSSVSVDRFISLFQLDSRISKDSVAFIRDYLCEVG